MKHGAIVTSVTAGAVLIVGASAALAAGWNVTGSGTGDTPSGAISAPATVSTTAQTNSSITLKVVAGPSGGATPTSYRVDRTVGTSPGPANSVCTISAVGGTCDDTGLSSGTNYSYVIRSLRGNWVSAASSTIATATTAGDTTPPSQSLSLNTVTGAEYLNNSTPSTPTLYYKGSAVGSFTLTDTVTDNGSGPASVTYPAIATTNWTHNAQTVSPGTGSGATKTYTSSTYSWTATNPANPGAQTIAAKDVANNSGTISVGFSNDSTVPSSGAITAPTASSTIGGTVSLTANAADAGSGVASVAYYRCSASCGAGGSLTLSNYTLLDTGVSSPSWTGSWDTTSVANGSYTLKAIITDHVGNQLATALVTGVAVSNAFTVSASTPQTAGAAFNLTITAKGNGVTNTDYDGVMSMSFSGPSDSANGSTPTYPTTVNFTNGVGTASITLVAAQTTTVTATSGNLSGTSSNLVVVANSTAAGFLFTSCTKSGGVSASCGSTLTTGNSPGQATAKVSVLDAYGNLTTNSGGTITVTFSNSNSSDFSVSGTVTIVGGASESSGSVTVQHLVNSSGSTDVATTNSGFNEDSIHVSK